ncbi:FG-GAP-like repeat-containing protein [Aestuariibaculum sp. YM273]|uniref:FG-GAP-like repeat-containing protein n=1 Tax=Aestuariibaculum sp. YM273 TaxID=3070659 RepID=UPI0027DD54B2|nr:FG-GAP-like repeat-containing protein [Aestuariibaculum sp. YM273]WMI65210.1 FG-GAP-like repeat-containing protein [Aestuariibaculum sp. YM273]
MKNDMIRVTFTGFMLCCFIIFNNYLSAQNFNRIETVAGLQGLEENNAVAIADYNKDGFLDVFVVAAGKDEDGVEKSRSRLYKNNNDGTFTDVTVVSGLLKEFYPITQAGEAPEEALKGVKFGAFWGDYDNDGYPDLFLTTMFKVFLFHNRGNGSFDDVTLQAGFPESSTCVYTDATWFDYNKDGLLDLYISDWAGCNGNSFYVNNGDGTFVNKMELFPDTDNKYSFMSIPFDVNNDGWQDLYVANDVPGQVNDLFINQKGQGFTEETEAYGLHFNQNAMGIALGDYNLDGFFDLYVTNIEKNVLFENNGQNTYYNETSIEQGVKYTEWAWDAVFADFDLDSDEDLFVVNGFDYLKTNAQKNIYFQNLHANGQSKFINKSEDSQLGDLTISVSAGVFDFDNDGDLDILVTNSDRPSYFYENNTTNFTYNTPNLHWLKIGLQGTNSNRDAIGTKIQVKTDKGILVRYFTGKGFLSQNKVPVHLGLANATKIEELKITWPKGLVEIYNNLPLDKTINFKEGDFYQVSDLEPSKKIYGCTDPNSCNYNPEATISSGTCVYLKTSSLIYGNSNVLVSSIEQYSYPQQEGNTVAWSISGGTILEGENANTVKVEWGTGGEGVISVIETNAYCSSQPVSLKVVLRNESDPLPEEEQSIARLWNETLLSLIRKDYARPTVHARNLFHTSVVLYDAWAVYDDKASPYLLGNTLHGFNSDFEGFTTTDNVIEARKKTISYAAYRLLSERFAHAPNPTLSQSILDEVMAGLGYDISITDEDYTTGNPIALGNYIASQMIVYGLQDGSNEINQYANQYYQPVNAPLSLTYPEGVADINPDRWQPLSFNNFIDQSGNVIGGVTPGFLSPEWGSVQPFSMEEEDKTTYTRDGHDYQVYYDPGAPPMSTSEDYKWCFSLVSKWSSHLDPHDGVLWDVSPKSIGNITEDHFPLEYADYKNFYKELEGGDIGVGRSRNPVTQLPYQEQIVPRGDYTRVLAEFWADGPDSETPPGHWFTILNYVNDHEMFTKQFEGEGNILSDLEWDVKAYFLMGGAMHDAAIAAWGVKGWYDYIRPISAIRYMCEIGQCTDTSQSNYNPDGIHLQDGLIEIVKEGDPLAGTNNEHVGKIKLYAWKGHDFIEDPKVDEAGVGWILAETWWPYQRPTFVTPPFAGFVSGHSTYSRAAAEVMTLLTGDEYFPGGMGEFLARKNEFLVFEEGPSVDVTLQWATYRDASDQCSLSRIWGGIHPPADDIPGRFMGIKIGQKAFSYGKQYFEGSEPSIDELTTELKVYPNPISTSSNSIKVSNTQASDVFQLFDINGRFLQNLSNTFNEATKVSELHFTNTLSTGVYVLKINNLSRKIVVLSR